MNEIARGWLGLRTGRGLNDRLSPVVRAKKVAHEREQVGLIAKVALSPRAFPRTTLARLLIAHRFVVLLTRESPSHKPLDDDNLRGSLKGCRDAIAARLGVDDGDRRLIRFDYDQRRAPWGVEFIVATEVRDG